MASPDKKKYNKMEVVLQYINKNFVTVSDEDTKKANPVLNHVIETIITAMKNVSPLFKILYESILYGGSFYDGLKVGKPEEFDIDLKLVLPKLVAPKLCLSNQPGFVTIQLTGWATFEKSNEYPKYKGLEAFKDDKDFLLVNKVLQWIESTVNLAMNEIGKVGNKTKIPYNGKYAEVLLKKSGPAVTALISYDGIDMDVDLVAVFKFTADMWPPTPFLRLPSECNGKTDFLIVPKTPKTNFDKKDRCWRMSFQEQEKVLISGNNTCKPALRLIKKLRDTQNHNMISSYFIKTVFLHEIEKHDKQFWNSSFSYIFMHMLKTYRDYLSKYTIPYYWNRNNNLLQHIDNITVDNFKNYLNRVIDSVDKKLEENPYVIGEFLCTSEEMTRLKQVPFTFPKTKSSIQNTPEPTITDRQTIDVLATKLKTCSSTNEVNSSVFMTKEIEKPKDLLLTTLLDIQQCVSVLQFDMKSALSKINNMEQSEQDIKNTLVHKFEASSISNQNSIEENENLIVTTLMDIKEKVNVLNTDIRKSLDKISSLEKSIADLQDDNIYFKTMLKKLVKQDDKLMSAIF